MKELDGPSPPNVTANLLDGLRIDEYSSRDDSSGTMSFLADALGSTIALTDSSGALSTQYTYEPYGKVMPSGPSNANSYQFTGRENDGTGLYYYRARYYSPTFQRFVSQDPLGFAAGDPALYGYVWQDPINLIDPLGLFCDPGTGMLIGSLVGLGLASIAAVYAFPEVIVAPSTFQLAAGLGSFVGKQAYLHFNPDCNPDNPNPQPQHPNGCQ